MCCICFLPQAESWFLLMKDNSSYQTLDIVRSNGYTIRYTMGANMFEYMTAQEAAKKMECITKMGTTSMQRKCMEDVLIKI